MEVDAVGQAGERLCIPAPLDELPDLVAARNLQGAGELPVDRVLNGHVDHPVYGQLTGPLQISNRYEVGQFIERCEKAEPLSALTDGIHLHTLSCPDEAAFERTKAALRALGVLLEESGN